MVLAHARHVPQEAVGLNVREDMSVQTSQEDAAVKQVEVEISCALA